jgi:hypothetical protein
LKDQGRQHEEHQSFYHEIFLPGWVPGLTLPVLRPRQPSPGRFSWQRLRTRTMTWPPLATRRLPLSGVKIPRSRQKYVIGVISFTSGGHP